MLETCDEYQIPLFFKTHMRIYVIIMELVITFCKVIFTATSNSAMNVKPNGLRSLLEETINQISVI